MSEEKPFGITPPRFGSFAKALLGLVLEPFGQFETLKVVDVEPQSADLLFFPSTNPPVCQHPMMRLLHQMSRGPVFFEPFCTTPTVDMMTFALEKQLTLDVQMRVEGLQVEMWVLSPGEPAMVLDGFGASPNPEYGIRGFYRLPELFRINLVAIRRLPRTPETLLLRLMGRGQTQRQALDELIGMMPDDLVTQVLSLCRRWIIIQQDAHLEDHMVTQELIDHARRIVERHEALIRAQGSVEGEAKGKAEMLAALLTRRLKRDLIEREVEALNRRVAESDSIEVLMDTALDLDPERLVEWLEGG